MAEQLFGLTTQQQARVGRVVDDFERKPKKRPGKTPPAITPTHSFAVEIVALENDYLLCKRIDIDGNPVDPAMNVAKPPKLRHDADTYELDTLTTVDTNTVDVVAGTTEEQWVVKHPYMVGDQLYVDYLPGALGATDGSNRLHLIDRNIDGRFWGIEGESEEIGS